MTERESHRHHEKRPRFVSLHVDGCDPLHKVTIIPRGRALGVTWNLPERDRYSMSMKQMEGAARALLRRPHRREQLIYGRINLNTGARNDIQQRPKWRARWSWNMACRNGLGWLRYRDIMKGLPRPQRPRQSVWEETAK